MSQADKLVMMANQIARNLAVQGADKAPALTANHIARFWDPRMRVAIIDLAAGESRLEPTARAAVRLLIDPRTKPGIRG